MTKHNFIYLLLSFIVLLSVQSCKTRNLTVDTQTINSKESLQKPYVVLISLDGFRWDYVEKYQPPHLTNFIKNGVQAESLIPSFPSKTFPNHYSIATGLYPENHRIIGNAFIVMIKKSSTKLAIASWWKMAVFIAEHPFGFWRTTTKWSLPVIFLWVQRQTFRVKGQPIIKNMMAVSKMKSG
ncbi:MAG: alkaline phosphatase family protein [Saprospiraceae bacterium]|nr:alkaline phosphatase family protein [Saprospiraceae bacterium]